MGQVKKYCFLFNDENIILKSNESYPEFLTVTEAEGVGIDNNKIIFMGTYEGNEFYATSTKDMNMASNYLSVEIDDIYDKVSESLFMLVLRGLTFMNWVNTNKHCKFCGAEVYLKPDKTYMQCEKCGQIIYLRRQVTGLVLQEELLIT